MTITGPLTERYISAVIRSLPASAQHDVRTELEGSIVDAVEARLEQGDDRADAERAVLTQLGDPGILAAGYAERPLHLVGPRFYLSWWRLLKVLLLIIPICAMGGVALGQTLAGASVGEVIGSAVVAGLGTIVHVAFWVTLVFVILERTGNAAALPAWTVDQLPESADRGSARADVIASLIFLVLAAGAVFWDVLRGFFPTDGAPIPVLHPDLWPWGITVLLVLIGAEALLAVAVYARGRWTRTLAVVNTLLAVAFAVWGLVLLTQGALVNPAFIEVLAGDGGLRADTLRILAIVTGAGLVAFPAWDIADGWIRARRAGRE